MSNKIRCDKCLSKVVPKNILPIENEYYKKYNFCKSCIFKAYKVLSMKIELTQDDKNLLTKIKQYLKIENN